MLVVYERHAIDRLLSLWQDTNEETAGTATVRWKLRFCVTLLNHCRQFEACDFASVHHRKGRSTLLKEIMGQKKATHIRFCDSDDEEDGETNDTIEEGEEEIVGYITEENDGDSEDGENDNPDDGRASEPQHSKLHLTLPCFTGLKSLNPTQKMAAEKFCLSDEMKATLELIQGPPGTGKTLLVKAVAHESSCVLFVCTASAMTSKWHGEGEKLLRTLFQVARAAAPSIIFVDEMDALLSSRKSNGEHEASRRFKTEFMTNMDGIVKNGGEDTGKHLLVIAATNCPWDIDSAVLRRFPRRIYVPLPDSTTRTALLENLLHKAGDTKMSKTDIKAVVKRLDGFSGSDIASIASEASFGPIRSLGGIDAIQAASSSDIRPIQKQDFDTAIDQVTKSVSKSLLKQYDEWKQEQAAS